MSRSTTDTGWMRCWTTGGPARCTTRRLEEGPDDLLLAYLIITEVIPRKALLRCFGDETPAFACKLLGLELEVPTCVHFRWDEQERRFDSVHYEVDMLTSLLKLLGNLEDASTVLNSPLGVD